MMNKQNFRMWYGSQKEIHQHYDKVYKIASGSNEPKEASKREGSSVRVAELVALEAPVPAIVGSAVGSHFGCKKWI